MRVGTVSTGEPGTDATVTNTGSENDAIFDFVIPRGADGKGTDPSVLTAYSDAAQTSAANTALKFANNSVIFGNAISHVPASANFVIAEPGVYLLTFHGSLKAEKNAAPSEQQATAAQDFALNATKDGTAIAGSTILVSLSSGQTESVAFTTSFNAQNGNIIQIVPKQSNVVFTNISATIVRLTDE